ncbi:MAG: LicD family protein [Aeriscardovia sp.]|nr:LicD family protein [Aeriscardovia sp.]MBR3360296.1 LicD family protein [Lachnospiraceae bacterium]
MKKLSSDEIKETIFQILSEFADYCDENNLRYFLAGGTLLGAVRHKGFIPWDDDIDVFMPRPDYERLHQVFKESPPVSPRLFLRSYENKKADFPFAKIEDLNTEIKEDYTTGDHHLWIDVFPIDGLPDDPNESARILNKAHHLRVLYSRSIARWGNGRTKFRALAKTLLLIIPKLRGCKYYGKKMHHLITQLDFNDCDYVASIAWSISPGERMKKTELLQSIEVEFCGKQFHAPGCTESYLTGLYGNYMELPPENKRINHSFDAYILEEG